mmetsp:Transcript_15323/g.37914  ORF Transcript_15323/g.37914 Transcript_15323/m.37914 type:complete len:225 (-) Transcript_15323:565-1239(-)
MHSYWNKTKGTTSPSDRRRSSSTGDRPTTSPGLMQRYLGHNPLGIGGQDGDTTVSDVGNGAAVVRIGNVNYQKCLRTTDPFKKIIRDPVKYDGNCNILMLTAKDAQKFYPELQVYEKNDFSTTFKIFKNENKEAIKKWQHARKNTMTQAAPTSTPRPPFVHSQSAPNVMMSPTKSATGGWNYAMMTTPANKTDRERELELELSLAQEKNHPSSNGRCRTDRVQL